MQTITAAELVLEPLTVADADWGRGYARMATHAMIDLADAYGTTQYLATVEAENR